MKISITLQKGKNKFLIYFSKDKIHPFKSGAVALNIFYKNKFFKGDYEILKDKITLIYDLLINSAELKEKGKIIVYILFRVCS
jgi:hypothetical protein